MTMAKRTSPTQRTLAYLRKKGWTCAVAEKFNPHVGPHGIRQDAFGFLDIICVRSLHPGVLGVQATSGANVAARVAKISEIDAARVWLEASNKIVVVGWRRLVQRKKDGSKSAVKRWRPRVETVYLNQAGEFDHYELVPESLAI